MAKRAILEKTQDYLVNTKTLAKNANKLSMNGQRIVDNLNTQFDQDR